MGFSVGQVLARTASIFARNILSFLLIAVVVYSPLYAWTVWGFSGDMPVLRSPQLYAYGIAIAHIVLTWAAAGAVTYGVFQQLRGAPASLGRWISIGMSRIPVILGTGILSALAILGVAFAVGLAFAFVAPVFAGLGTAGAIILGIIVAIPALIVACALWVAVPVAVVERVGPFQALSRSSGLTGGYRFGIFVIILCLWLIGNLALPWIFQQVFSPATQAGAIAFTLGLQFLAALLGVIGAVASVVAYHDLRVTKEGIGTEDLASVFD